MTQIIPGTIRAGIDFTAAFTQAVGDVMTAALLLRGPASYDIPAVRDGDTFHWSVPANTTKDWEAGAYAYAVRLTDGTSARDIEFGRLAIAPDLAALPAGHDARSEWRKGLDAIDAVLGKRATLDQERYRINNRELYRTPIADLLKLRAFYQQKVDEESGVGRRGRFRELPVTMRPVR